MSLIVSWLYFGSLCSFQEAALAGGSRLPVAGLWRFCLFLCFLVHCHWRPTLSCFCHRVWRSPFTHSHAFSAGMDRIYETISPNTGFFPWAFSVKCFATVMRKATNTDVWLASLPGEGVWEVPRRKEKNRQQEQVFYKILLSSKVFPQFGSSNSYTFIEASYGTFRAWPWLGIHRLLVKQRSEFYPRMDYV